MSKMTIDEFIKRLETKFSDAINDVIAEASSGPITLGINQLLANGELYKIKKHLDLSNQIFEAYLIAFQGKEKSYQTFINDVLPLMNVPVDTLALELRKNYVKYHNIEIPKHFRLDKTVFSLDYEAETESAFEKINSLFIAWVASKLKSYQEDLHWNAEQKEFGISDALKDSIIQKHTVNASSNDILYVIGLFLIGSGLNELTKLIDLDEYRSIGLDFTTGKDLYQESIAYRKAVGIVSRKLIETNKLDERFAFDWNSVLKAKYDRAIQSKNILYKVK